MAPRMGWAGLWAALLLCAGGVVLGGNRVPGLFGPGIVDADCVRLASVFNDFGVCTFSRSDGEDGLLHHGEAEAQNSSCTIPL